jgi:hypothetical protein
MFMGVVEYGNAKGVGLSCIKLNIIVMSGLKFSPHHD